MNIKPFVAAAVVLLLLLSGTGPATAYETDSPLEKSMSDTLDIWREGRYEQLFEQLAHRGKVSLETFVEKMSDSTIRPACCWRKMENFKVLNEKRTQATVYVKIGLDDTTSSSKSTTREFKMNYQEGVWKMQLADVFSIAEATGKKKKSPKHNSRNPAPYHN